MTFRVDLHVHTKYSGDNHSEPEEAILRAIEVGLDGIAFTEHYSYAASEHAEVLKEKYKGKIKIFRGVEFSTLEGHCLVFGVDTDGLAVKYIPFKDLLSIVNKKGGVVIPSHPYRGINSVGDLILKTDGFCAIEGYNGCNLYSFNLKAVEAACRLNIPYTGGSDAHSPSEIGLCYTEFYNMLTEDNFIEFLRQGNYFGVDTRKISKVKIPIQDLS